MLTLHFTDIEDYRKKAERFIIHDEIMAYIREKVDNEGMDGAIEGLDEITTDTELGLQTEINKIINECREILYDELKNKDRIPLHRNQILVISDDYILLVDAYETTLNNDNEPIDVYAAEAIKGYEAPDAEGWQDVYVLYWHKSNPDWDHPEKVIKPGIKYNTNTGKFL